MSKFEKLTEKDKQLLKQKGISEQELELQVSFFESGFPFLDIASSASLEKGIMNCSKDEIVKIVQFWIDNVKNYTVTKFVPASGAASRMFKDLFSFLDADYDAPQNEAELKFFDNIERFAFFEALNKKCLEQKKMSISELIEKKRFKEVVSLLLNQEGLNYGALPKGVLEFHKSVDGSVRTPVEEHLQEGAIYAVSGDVVDLHFTVSKEHQQLFESLINEKKAIYEGENKVKYNITFSNQSPKTDTVAVHEDNSLFRVDDTLLFRPAGHGALIENLNALDSDVIFVKNIDNVVPDQLKGNEANYKMLLGGILLQNQSKIFAFLEMLDKGDYSHDQLMEVLHYLQDVLNIKNTEVKWLEDSELALYLKQKLNRPIRVCGMVKNIGEPGGGPFFVKNADQVIELQILESTQIDFSDVDKATIAQESSHFNPVDLICGVKDFRGNKFHLTDYVDNNAGFISDKSLNGQKLKALELPGLWNGAMSNWNTIFVDVPLSTFNPVKTVNDLLRKEHQLS